MASFNFVKDDCALGSAVLGKRGYNLNSIQSTVLFHVHVTATVKKFSELTESAAMVFLMVCVMLQAVYTTAEKEFRTIVFLVFDVSCWHKKAPIRHKICRCELNHMVKFHWQIYRAILSELYKMCSCKWRTLTKWFDTFLDVGVKNVTNYLFVRWHLAKMGDTVNTLCPLYKVFKTNVMCRTRKTKSIRTAREKKRVGSMTNSCENKWPKEVKPLLYFLIELIQNPNFLPD